MSSAVALRTPTASSVWRRGGSWRVTSAFRIAHSFLAAPYLLQEAAAAHQLRTPFLILKTPEVSLQGVTSRNLYLEIEPELSERGRVRFKGSKRHVLSSLRSLKHRAEARLRERRQQAVAQHVKTGVAWAAGGIGVLKVIDWLSRPECFADYSYRDPECRDCEFKPDCKAEKARRSA